MTGIILFLYGMMQLNRTIQAHFSSFRIREYFKLTVKTPLYGIVAGIVTTIFFQSSSATSVLTVGLVSAGLIPFFHSLGIILGADIGTTLTVQLVVWKITDISPLLILTGALIWIMGRERWKSGGEALFYFGLIFFGLYLTSTATAPLKDSPFILTLLEQARHPLIGVAIGLALTAIIQSSAIPISLLVILALHGMVTIESALPIVFGANLGTAVTALIAGIVATTEGKRCALSHFIFKLIGVIVCLIFLTPFSLAVASVSSATAQQIAAGHFLFNLVIVIVITPFLRPFARLVERVMPGTTESFSLWPEYLDERVLSRAPEALENVRREMHRIIVMAYRMLEKSLGLLSLYKDATKRDVGYLEMTVDHVRAEIARYLCAISETTLSPELSRVLLQYSTVTDNIESMADHAMNIATIAEEKEKRNHQFSADADRELEIVATLVVDNVTDTILLFETPSDEIIRRILKREDTIDRQENQMRERHFQRVYTRLCRAEAGPAYLEILVNLERISDHCENIAEYMADILKSRETGDGGLSPQTGENSGRTT